MVHERGHCDRFTKDFVIAAKVMGELSSESSRSKTDPGGALQGSDELQHILPLPLDDAARSW